MWLKNRCAMDITRVARGFIARVGNRQERQRLHDDEQQRWAAEAHAVEVAGDVAVKEILEYLAGFAVTTFYLSSIPMGCTSQPELRLLVCLSAGKGREEVEAGAVLLQNRARVLSTQRKEDNWQAQLRDLFVLFDVDQRGALDEDQLAMLLQEMCIPVTPDELHTAVTDMDQDGNGLIELAEFTQYFASLGFRDPDDMGGDDEIPDASDSDDDAAAAAGSRKNMRAKMAKMKLQLKAQKLKNEFFGTVYRKLAERSIVNKAKEAARRIARKNFRCGCLLCSCYECVFPEGCPPARRKFPPRYFCTKCIKTFIFERQLVAHWRAGCSPLDMKS
jgi:EF-hand domain pair